MAPKKSTSSRLIPIQRLEASSFANFGQVIQNPATHDGTPVLSTQTANQGTATKYLDITHLTNHYGMSQSAKPAKPVINMFACKPRQLHKDGAKEVFPVSILERHPFTPQTFIPMGLDAEDARTCYLVVVAPTLPLRSRPQDDTLTPAYPTPPPRRKRSLRERLVGARPNPFTNDFTSSTTPAPASPSAPKPKGPGLPDLDNLQAFIARGEQAVTYGPGTWHAPMVVLGDKSIEFIVVQYANGVTVEDCQEVEIEAKPGESGLQVDVSGVLDGAAAPRAKL